MANLYIGLVHYPIMNKHKEVITTAITNYDIHDIARASITFGSTYNPDRKDAFTGVELVNSIAVAVRTIEDIEGIKPIVATTDARTYDNTISYARMREHLENEGRPVLVLFGTGYGMTKETMESFDYILEPIYGHGEYNHLSVRSAVSIILDRLRGEAWWNK
ncbi:MAG: RNA methyltransferase [Veillonella parvula]|nr:RNA methyltransferase [Veillonella parvula]